MGLKTREIALSFANRFQIEHLTNKACRVEKKITRFVRKKNTSTGNNCITSARRNHFKSIIHILERAPSAKKGSNFTSASAVHVGAR